MTQSLAIPPADSGLLIPAQGTQHDAHLMTLGGCRAEPTSVNPSSASKPYSVLMGSMKLVDTVTVSFCGERAKDLEFTPPTKLGWL